MSRPPRDRTEKILRAVLGIIVYCAFAASFRWLLDAPVWAAVGFALVLTRIVMLEIDVERYEP